MTSRTTTPEDIAKIKSTWVGLTDEEIIEAYAGGMHVLSGNADKGFARAIEAKLKEKNA